MCFGPKNERYSVNKSYKNICIALLCLLVVDSFVDSPKGFAWLRRLFGLQLHGSVKYPCGWDDEGQWKIGLVQNGKSPWQWSGIGANEPIITCADLGPDIKASFVADPFLVQKSDKAWYLFFEYKNLERMIGELGVSFSSDGGTTWTFQGTVLSEPFHLSHPHVIQDRTQPGIYQMVPETGEAEEVRIYETTSDKFPFGWQLKHTPLKGKPFLDTGIVWHENTYWIFTTVHSNLHLYYTQSLTKHKWAEHPMSPIITNDSRFARSGGRPVVHNGSIYRYAQEGSNFYGGGVHIFRAHVLTKQIYREQHLTFIEPNATNPWTQARFHHMDVHKMRDSSWIAVFDADTERENSHFFEREGWFYYLKRILICLISYQLYRFPIEFGYFRIRLLYFCKQNKSRMKDTLAHFIAKQTKIISHNRCLCQDLFSVKSIMKLCIVLIGCVMFATYSTDITRKYVEPLSHETSECFGLMNIQKYSDIPPSFLGQTTSTSPKYATWHQDDTILNDDDWSNVISGAIGDSLVIVTACSSTYFIRLKNLVGSIHFWEPNLNILIYDIGLSEEELTEIAQWKRVEVKAFNFQKYPTHVTLLYNFAWKVLVIREVLEQYENVLFLDSGVEIRHPLIAARHFMQQDGFYSSLLDNGGDLHRLGTATHPDHFKKLKEYGVNFDEEEISKYPFCAGGVQGFVRHRTISLFRMYEKCALDPSCIAPDGSDEENHNFDQSAITILIYAMGKGHTCDHKDIYVDENHIEYTVDETRCNHIEMGGRRYRVNRPYTKHIDIHAVKQPAIKKTDTSFLVERRQRIRYRLGSEDKFENCLKQCNEKFQARTEWNACSGKCRDAFKQKNNAVMNQIVWRSEYWFYLLRKGCACRLVQFRASILFMCIVLLPFGRRKAKMHEF